MNNLSDSCFAYPSMRKYPIHTKEAACNSYQAFSKEASCYPKPLADAIKANFEKAAAYHEIELESLNKQAAAPATPELISFKGDDGVVTMSKISSAVDIPAAVSKILEYRGITKRANLKEAAKYVLWAASNADFDMETAEMKKIARIAGIGVGDRDKIQEEFEKRATLNIFDGASKDAFWKFAADLKALSDDDFYSETNLNKICSILEETDVLYGNNHKYGSTLAYPEDVVFSETVDDLLKEASDLLLIPSIDTTISKKALLERGNKANAFLKTYLGQETDLAGDDLLGKVASLDADTASALLERIA